jgi:hypothetical protein
MTIPSDVTGLRGWWKADAIVGLTDGQDVTTWEDSSASNNDGTGATNKPTYQTNEVNGLPCVRFVSASSQHINVNVADMLAMTNNKAGFTAFAYVNLTTPSAAIRNIFAVNNGTTSGQARIKFGQRATGSGVWSMSGRRLDADAQANLEGGATQSGWQLITVVSDWANSNADIWRGETSEATTTTWLADGNTSATDALAVRMGSNPSGTSEFWEGDIAELAVYDNVVASGDRTALWDYFQAKYEAAAPSLYMITTPLRLR